MKTQQERLSKQELYSEDLINRIVNRIRQSLELEEILQTTAREVQSLLNVARVKIYRFSPDRSGEVIAESLVGKALPSLLGLHFPAGDIPPIARTMFLKARQRVIVDVAAARKTINHLDCPLTGANLAKVDIRHLPVDPCHIIPSCEL